MLRYQQQLAQRQLRQAQQLQRAAQPPSAPAAADDDDEEEDIDTVPVPGVRDRAGGSPDISYCM